MRAILKFSAVAAALGLSLACLPVQLADARSRELGGAFWNYYNYPWCIYTMNDFSECTFETMTQCNATRAGVGGSCFRNPRLADNDRQIKPPNAARLQQRVNP